MSMSEKERTELRTVRDPAWGAAAIVERPDRAVQTAEETLPEPSQLLLFELPKIEEEWAKLTARKFPIAEPIAPQLPDSDEHEGLHRYTEIPVRFSGSGIIKGFSVERIGNESGQASRQALVWNVEAIGITIDKVG